MRGKLCSQSQACRAAANYAGICNLALGSKCWQHGSDAWLLRIVLMGLQALTCTSAHVSSESFMQVQADKVYRPVSTQVMQVSSLLSEQAK